MVLEFPIMILPEPLEEPMVMGAVVELGANTTDPDE
jgi:hypothetical protein